MGAKNSNLSGNLEKMNKRKRTTPAKKENGRAIKPFLGTNNLRSSPEIKDFDIRATINTGITWTFIHLVNMVQGTAVTQRVGNRVRVLSVDVRTTINLDNQLATANPLVGDDTRACLIQDKQSNGLIVAGLDVFSANAINEFQATTSTKRFVRLVDKKYPNVNPMAFVGLGGGGDGCGSTYAHMNLHYSAKPIEVEFIANGGTFASVGTNGIWFAVCSSTGSSFIDYVSRVRYVDF